MFLFVSILHHRLLRRIRITFSAGASDGKYSWCRQNILYDDDSEEIWKMVIRGNPTAMTVMVVTTDDDGPPLWAMGKVWAQVSPHATFIQEVDGSGNDDDGDDDDDDDTTHNRKLYEGY